MRKNHEITTQGPLLNAQGNLNEPGWARHLLPEYRREDIKAPKFRIKEWDYYLVMGDDFAAAFTISDDGYIGLQSVSLLELGEKPWEHTETVLNVMPMGKLKLPSSSEAGITEYKDKRLHMKFEVQEDGSRRIRCKFMDFCEKQPFHCDIVLTPPPEPAESMVIATPWDKDKHFYYNQKILGMRASGWVEWHDKKYRFDPERNFGTLDWGRGVWTYDNTWFWGAGNCDLDGHTFGFNIGYGFGNTEAASENVLLYDGKIHKLDDITFNLPENGYTDPWTFSSSDGRFEMEFTPILDRAAKIDLKVLVSDQHQVFGRMSGKAILDDGTELVVKDLLCFAEHVHNRY